jgi:hypothetical protein
MQRFRSRCFILPVPLTYLILQQRLEQRIVRCHSNYTGQGGQDV